MVSEARLRELVEANGYRLLKIVRFKRRDRIVLEKDGVKITLYLKCKLEQLSEEILLDWLGGATLLYTVVKGD